MIRKSEPVSRLTEKPARAHGMNALTSRRPTPRKRPMRRKPSTPAPPIKTQRPRKWRDSQAGHNHDTPNSALEIAVDSSQDEKSAISASNTPSAGQQRSPRSRDRAT